MTSLKSRTKIGPTGHPVILDAMDRVAITIVNPNDRAWTTDRYLLTFGAYGDTRLLVYASSADDALDEAIDWIADHAPGLLADEQVADAYTRAIAEGKSDEQAQDEATTDMTCGGNEGHYVCGWEWTIDSGITRAYLASLAF